nr:immunoglobulin heavy chain junction region [Macaca mulatta]
CSRSRIAGTVYNWFDVW